jgi:DNA invertase Pin-like site-specific DNA recombinase
MKVGYARVSTSDQSLDLQISALVADGVANSRIYRENLSGATRARPYFEDCLKSLREGDTLVVYSLDRLGRSTKDLIEIISELESMSVDLRILEGIAKGVDTSTSMGRMFFTIASSFAEYERELIRERTIAGIKAARDKGHVGGRKPALTPKQIRTVQAAIKGGAVIKHLADDLGVTRKTLYQYVSPLGELRELGQRVLKVSA